MVEAPTANPPGERPEPTEERAALVKRWGQRIDQALKDNDKLFKAFEARRKRVRGVTTTEGAESVSNSERTNLVYATIASILPQVYAKNPDISVTPTEGVPGDRYANIKQFCKTLESVLHAQLVKGANLKDSAKDATRSAMTTSLGWVKLLYQRDIETDPVIQNRMNDAQENLKRVQASLANIEDPAQIGELTANKAQLEQELKGLAGQLEKVIAQGLVIDNILSEHLLILDPTVRSFKGYRQAGAMAQIIYFTKEKFEAAFGYVPKTATVYTTAGGQPREGTGEVKLYQVFEIWDKDTNTVYTLCKGEKDFCREPYQPQKLGAHWYPFFPLAFNLVDGQFYPMSDVELIEKLSDEYNETAQQLKDARDESIPGTVVREGGNLSPDDIEKIKRRKPRETVVISGPGGKPLSDDIQEIGGVTTNPLLYDRAPIRQDIDTMSGATDALRGSVSRAKTATEAEYMQAGLAGRTGERQDATADWISSMAQYAAEILLQELTPQQVLMIAGEGAQWPQMTKEEALSMVRIEVRAGTMGKPDKSKEQEQWTKVLPVLQEGMKNVADLRAKGMNDMADAVIELLRETLRRFDERIDLDKFIPPAENNAPNPGQLMAENAQLKQQLAEAQAQAKEGASQERVALINAAGDVITEVLKSQNQSQPDVAAVVQAIINKAAEIQQVVPASGQPQTENMH